MQGKAPKCKNLYILNTIKHYLSKSPKKNLTNIEINRSEKNFIIHLNTYYHLHISKIQVVLPYTNQYYHCDSYYHKYQDEVTAAIYLSFFRESKKLIDMLSFLLFNLFQIVQRAS